MNRHNTADLARIVKADRIALHYNHADGETVIHREGCRHDADEKQPYSLENAQADDWFGVAPCARRA